MTLLLSIHTASAKRYELTYFKSRRRWKKMVNGKVKYFGEQCSKSDWDAYLAAREEYRRYIDGLELGAPSTLDVPPMTDVVGEPLRKHGRKGAIDYRRNVEEVSVGECVKMFLAEAKQDVDNGNKSAEYYAQLKAVLQPFIAYAKADTSINDVSGAMLKGYRSILLDQIKAEEISPVTANHRLKQVKRLVRWVWELEYLNELPRIITSTNSLAIPTETKAIQTYEPSEVRELFNEASLQTKAYIALAVNCLFTQTDIAQLDCANVDFKKGVITHRRSKTGDYENVPTVRFPLWDVTRKLLDKCAATQAEGLVFRNENGNPLLTTEVTEDGRLRKNDNIRNAWNRIVKKMVNRGKRAKVDNRSFKHFRKTSATLLASHKDYAQVRYVCLGHSPKSIADKHYSAPSQVMINEAIEWLGKQYGLTLDAPASNQKGSTRSNQPGAVAHDWRIRDNAGNIPGKGVQNVSIPRSQGVQFSTDSASAASLNRIVQA